MVELRGWDRIGKFVGYKSVEGNGRTVVLEGEMLCVDEG